MTDQPPPPLHRLGVIAEEIRELQQLCEETDHPAALAELVRLMHRIGELQLQIAQAATDAATLAEMERQFPQVRTSLD